jgi:hypothetical protein
VVVCVLNNGQHTTGILDLHGGGGRKEGRKQILEMRERERERERGLLQFLSYSHQLPSFVFFAENKSLR